MSLDKAIAHGKEHRKPYRKSERFDKSCRPHGDCPVCERRHQIAKLRANSKAQDELRANRDCCVEIPGEPDDFFGEDDLC